MAGVAGGLCSLEYAKDGANITDSSRDATLTKWIVAATPMIEDVSGPILPKLLTKRFNGGKDGVRLPYAIEDEDAVISVSEDETPITDWWTDEDARIVYAGGRGMPRRFSAGRKNILVRFRVGVSGEIPETIQLAARELIRVWVMQGITAPQPSWDGNGVVEMRTTPQGFALPKKVYELAEIFNKDSGLG